MLSATNLKFCNLFCFLNYEEINSKYYVDIRNYLFKINYCCKPKIIYLKIY